MQNLVIIGAGLSGTLLVVNLLRISSGKDFRIIWIDKNSRHNLGPAYSTNEAYLLNVPVEKMGAFPENPGHFYNWCKHNNVPLQKGDYLPRKLFREYIHGILLDEINTAGENKKFKRIKGEALDINVKDNKAIVFVSGSRKFIADKVVLALGNLPPKNPEIKNKYYLKNKRYKPNPWKPDIFKNISLDDSIIFLGTGQTMVDLAAGLFRKNHKGKMIAVSRRGILPMSQKTIQQYPSFYDELRDQNSVLSLFQIVRKHIRTAGEKGLDPRAVIDSLRPHTREIWMQLAVEEKLKFLRHIFRYWEIIRSRIPLVNEKILNEMQLSGQLRVEAGRIVNIMPQAGFLRLKYIERKTKTEKIESADYVINCMGPNTDYEQVDDPLINNLTEKGLLHCDPLHLGINALPGGNVLNEDGTASSILFTIGPPLRGILWESIAVPEIRSDAEKLANILLADS